jgi:LacI family transcriptional regulator
MIQVALCLTPTVGYFGDLLLGVQEFVRQHPNWITEISASYRATRGTLEGWKPDGILVDRRTDEPWEPLIRGFGGPVVQVGGQAMEGVPRVSSDNHAIGQIAAEYFLQRGFQNFAYCGYTQLDWSQEREQGYRAALTRAGFGCESFPEGKVFVHAGTITTHAAAWISKLPRPVAIFACHDRIGMLLVKSCEVMGLRVPEDVAVLGVDNNPFECMITEAPLSSIAGSARRIGYEAASLLDNLIHGQPAPSHTLVVPPAGVVTRQSTDILALEDPDLIAAMRYIEKHAGSSIRVQDVAEAVLVTRRMLERKFRAILKRSPREEILRCHVEHAKNLLVKTRDSIMQVGLKSGFPSSSKFASVFRREAGMTPTEFRDRYGMHVQ